MNPRERVKITLQHKEPDRVPIDIGGGASTSIIYDSYIKLAKYLKINYIKPIEFQSPMLQIVNMDNEIMELLSSDCRPLLGRTPKKNNYGRCRFRDNETYIDEWGIIWEKAKGAYYYSMIEHPIKETTVDAIKKYSWPNPADSERTKDLEKEAEYLYKNTQYALVAHTGAIDIWQKAFSLCGYEQMLINLLLKKKFVHTLFERILEYNKIIFKNFLIKTGKYIDVIRTADDLATANSLLMSPETYREMLKPYHKELFSFIKKYTDAKIFFHSCGNVYPLINDLIETGIDILNPIQVSAKDMSDTAKLKDEFGNRVCFWGGIDTTRILPFGDESEVEKEVKTRINDLAKGGGYILAPVHNIQPDVSARNICAMINAAKKYGIYQ